MIYTQMYVSRINFSIPLYLRLLRNRFLWEYSLEERSRAPV